MGCSGVRLIAAILMTPLGSFLCSGITCEGTPDADIAGYWRREQLPRYTTDPPRYLPEGALFVTVAGKPWAVLRCVVTEETTARGETVGRFTCD